MTRHVRFIFCIAALALAACTDRPTSPNAAALGSRASLGVNPAHPGSAVTASATWELTAGSIAASRAVTPLVAARDYGLLGIAQYGAAVAASPDDGESNADPTARYFVIRGAVAGASAQVLKYVFPLDVTAIEAQLTSEGGIGTPGVQSQFARGVALGRAIGDIVVARGRADGFANPDGTPKVWDPTTLPVGPTIWHMDADATPHVPAGFQFPAMRAYYLTSNDQFRPPPPPADPIPDLNEVIAIVNARTPQQADIARFWNLAQGTPTAPGYWDQQAAMYVAEYGLDEVDAAHVFALMNSAEMDAVLGCWDAKYHYLALRPWMRAPADLPNSKLIIGRPNHPSYPSGHSCVSSSAAAVLESFFPSKSATLDAEVTEAGMSRIYGGIHYRSDIDAGRVLGQSVARWAIDYDREHGLLAAVMP